jgi:PII-like signaling protein
MREGMRLTVHLGDRDRVEGRLLADVLLDCYARHNVRSSVLLRGIEGFGIKHRLASERLLTLSEDLPLLALAIDTPERIDAMLAEVLSLTGDGAITLERARLLDDGQAGGSLEPGSDAVKLTAYVGRQERIGSKPAYMEIVECLHRHGVAGASVLLGLDGTVHGVRRRARFLARNAQVPMMLQSLGEAHTIAAALAELSGSSSANLPAMALERVRVCKRDGVRLAEPIAPPQADADGRGYWQKLVVYSSERSRYQGQPLHSALVRRLRREGAAGATVLRGQWGFHGDHAPHGEAFWSLARSVPVLSVLLDTPENMGRWFEIVDELTAETGLVTSELVPALRAAGPGDRARGVGAGKAP